MRVFSLANLLAFLEKDEGVANGSVDLVAGEGGLVGGLREGRGVVCLSVGGCTGRDREREYSQMVCWEEVMAVDTFRI